MDEFPGKFHTHPYILHFIKLEDVEDVGSCRRVGLWEAISETESAFLSSLVFDKQ